MEEVTKRVAEQVGRRIRRRRRDQSHNCHGQQDDNVGGDGRRKTDSIRRLAGHDHWNSEGEIADGEHGSKQPGSLLWANPECHPPVRA